MNIETIIITLLVPIITGLAFVAYKHPFGFRKIANGFGRIFSVIILMIIAWNWGTMQPSIDSLQGYLNTTKDISNLTYSINNLDNSRNTINTGIVIYIISMIYIVFLYNLPKILGLTIDKPEQSSKEHNEQKGGGS